MARYSPGTSSQFPSGLVFALPIWKQAVNIVDPDYQPDETNFAFTANRFGELATAAEFPNSDSKIQFSSSSPLHLQEFTFCFWINLSSLSNDQSVINFQRVSGSGSTSLAVRLVGATPDNLSVRFNLSGGGAETLISQNLSVDTDYFVLVDFNSTESNLYINNSLEDNDLIGDTIDYSNLPFAIGNQVPGNRPLNGSMNSLYWFNRVLTSAERLFMYNFYEVGKGSQGGNTFQRSGKSFSIRSRKKPRFQRTARTSLSRNAFHHVQSNWRQLSSGDKTSWSNQVANFGRTNSLGIPYDLEPIQLFESFNKVRVDFQLTIEETATAPVVFPDPGIDQVQLFADTGDAFVDLIPVEVPAGFVYNIFLSEKLLSPPENLDNQTFYLMTSFDEGTDSDIFFNDAWVGKFGITPQDAGKFQVFKLEIFHRPSGQRIIDGLVSTEIQS